MNVVKKSSILFSIIFCLVLFSTSVACADVYVCNGDEESGWEGYGTFNIANYGWDGTMYWTWGHSGAAGWWQLGTGGSNVRYYVYIPNHNAYANVTYDCYYSPTQAVHIAVDQSLYSNQWVRLTKKNAVIGSQIVTGDGASSSSTKVGFDDACFLW